MGIEIERKYLVTNDTWQQNADEGIYMIQGYMSSNDKSSVRIRANGDTANLNIKSKTIGAQRSEYDYAIPVAEAMEILETLCDKPFIVKTRYHVGFRDKTWEIDVFAGENQGLIVAEVELNSVNENFSLPDWVGKEVTKESRYYNICLISNPYKDW